MAEGSSASQPAGKREPFAMAPESLFLGRVVPEGDSGSDAMAVYLFLYLDLRQGKGGRPTRGYRYVARQLGWQERTVARYARLLSARGLIELDEGDPKAAHSRASMLVVHNPARYVWNPSCPISEEVRAGVPKAGTRHRHGPLPAPSIARAETRPLSRDALEGEGRPLSRDAHDGTPTPVASDASTRRTPRATSAHATRHPPSTPVAPDASGPRSKRYEVGLRAGFRERGGKGLDGPASEVSAIARLEEAFGPVEVVDETLALCAACGLPADGQPDPSGTPMCRTHEPF